MKLSKPMGLHSGYAVSVWSFTWVWSRGVFHQTFFYQFQFHFIDFSFQFHFPDWLVSSRGFGKWRWTPQMALISLKVMLVKHHQGPSLGPLEGSRGRAPVRGPGAPGSSGDLAILIIQAAPSVGFKYNEPNEEFDYWSQNGLNPFRSYWDFRLKLLKYKENVWYYWSQLQKYT